MAKFFVHDHTGHTVLEYDLKDHPQVKEAMEKFEELIKGGAAGTRKSGEKDYKQVRGFNQIEDETVFLRAMQGG